MSAHNGWQKSETDVALVEAKHVRETADLLLSQLIDDRAFCERRSAEAARIDPLKFVTGSSALDRAVVATRDMIRRLELVTDEITGGPLVAATSQTRIEGSLAVPIAQ